MSTVLLISDDDLEIEAARDLLTNMGFDIYVVDSKAEARLFCETRQPDAVIVDIEMEGGNGFEAISLLRRTSRNCIVVATTRGRHENIWPMVAIACGADSYVVGPLTTDKVVDAIPDARMRLARH